MKPVTRRYAKPEPLPNQADFRVPPQDLELEQLVLGAMILSPDALIDCRAILDQDDFYREAHRKLFRAICELDNKREPVDIPILANELKRMGEFEAIGGSAALAHLVELTPTKTANADEHARIVKEKSKGRKLIHIFSNGLTSAYQDEQSPDEISDAVMADLTRSASRVGVVSAMDVAGEITADWYKKTDDYLPTEWPNFNAVLKGLRVGTVITVTGPSYQGKSTLVQNLSVQMARLKHKVLHIALEGTRKEVAKRQICLIGNVRLPVLDSNDEQVMTVGRKIAMVAKWSELGITYADKHSMGRDWIHLRANMIREIKRNGVKVVFIEGGEKIVCRPAYGEEKWSAQERLVEELDDVARTYKVPIIVIVGQSAGGAEGMNKSKREGGTYNWSKVADQRIYVKRVEKFLNLVEVTKNRDGPIGKCYMNGTEDTYRWTPAEEPKKEGGDER